VARKCKNKKCGKTFEPQFNTIQPCCSIKCAIEYSQEKKKAEKSKEARKQKTALRQSKISYWHDKLQPIFNKYIRLRDAHLPCISCGTFTPKYYPRKGQWDAGHFRTRGAAPELRYEEKNVHKECVHCNLHNTEHLLGYRRNLILKIGIKDVHWLEGPHDPKNYTIPDLKELIEYYKAKIKLLEAEQKPEALDQA
jgi:hypothetical protein